ARRRQPLRTDVMSDCTQRPSTLGVCRHPTQPYCQAPLEAPAYADAELDIPAQCGKAFRDIELRTPRRCLFAAGNLPANVSEGTPGTERTRELRLKRRTHASRFETPVPGCRLRHDLRHRAVLGSVDFI